MNQRILAAGAWNTGLAVALGAFGAHALRDHLTESAMKTFGTGQLYHLVHGLAGVAVGLWAGPRNGRAVAWCFGIGTLVFSGSLYLLAITGQRWLGAITPLGGTAWIAGWVALGLIAWRTPDEPKP